MVGLRGSHYEPAENGQLTIDLVWDTRSGNLLRVELV